MSALSTSVAPARRRAASARPSSSPRPSSTARRTSTLSRTLAATAAREDERTCVSVTSQYSATPASNCSSTTRGSSPDGTRQPAIRPSSRRIAGPAESAKAESRMVLPSLRRNGSGGAGTSSSTTRPQIEVENCSRELPTMPELSAVPSVRSRNRCPEK